MAPGHVYDILILGASGFTGKYVLREFLHCMAEAQRWSPHDAPCAGVWPPFTMALAGRNVSKLRETLAWAVATAPLSVPPQSVPSQSELQKIEFIAADALDAAAVDSVCSQARVVVNCVGPCLLYGETIVAACVKAGVHYVDISGEAEFMEKMELKYGESARESRSIIVSGCGSVSAISDLGLLHHLRQWPLDAAPTSVDGYASFYSFTCNFAASAETGFLALGNAEKLANFRHTAPRKPKLKIPGCPPTDKGKFVHREQRLGVWATALPICDRAVVRRTFWGLHGHPLGLSLLDETTTTLEEREKIWKPIRPVHYRVFFGAHQFVNAFLFSFMAQLVSMIATYAWGQKLLMRHTEIFTLGKFTRRGPRDEDMRKTRFELQFVGRGSSCSKNVKEDMEVVTRVTGPEPAYITTAINIAQNAMMCIYKRNLLPVGGVLTTATAFGGSHMQQCLESRGITFEHITTNVGTKILPHSSSITLAKVPFKACIFFVFLLLVPFLVISNRLLTSSFF